MRVLAGVVAEDECAARLFRKHGTWPEAVEIDGIAQHGKALLRDTVLVQEAVATGVVHSQIAANTLAAWRCITARHAIVATENGRNTREMQQRCHRLGMVVSMDQVGCRRNLTQIVNNEHRATLQFAPEFAREGAIHDRGMSASP